MIEFPLLHIWSKFHRKAIVSYYTQSRARSKESGEIEHSVHDAEAESPSISTCHVAAHASGLGERVTTDVIMWWASVFRVPTAMVYMWSVDVCIISITQTSMRPAQATHCVGG